MSRFTQGLLLEPLTNALDRSGLNWYPEDEGSWVLRTANFAYCVGELDSEDCIEVPFNFMTDLASIPRMFRWLISPSGRHNQAAIVHDVLYRCQDVYGKTKEEADLIFLEAMQVLGVPKWRRQVMYHAVDKFSHKAWARNTNNPPPITLLNLIESRRQPK